VFGNLFKKKAPGLDQQLRDLESCGVRLLPEASPAALLREWSQADFEKSPYLMVAISLGGGEAPLSENLWHFDTECIEDHGAYLSIAERFRDLAGGDLPLLEIEDYVDIEAGEAWLAFKLDGASYRWECKVDDDWVDPTVLARFAELLAKKNSKKRFTYLDTGGQDCVIGCFSEEERSRLRKVTGLDWKLLT
jgi:hypothetical protein